LIQLQSEVEAIANTGLVCNFASQFDVPFAIAPQSQSQLFFNRSEIC